jgi:hypothetical protein
MSADFELRSRRDGESPSGGGPGGERLRSLPGLLGALARDIGELLRKEAELARAELGEKFAQASSGVSQLGIAALVSYAGALFLLAALVLVLDLWLQALWASSGLVGVLVTALGALLLRRGRSKLSSENLAPERTANSLRRDMRVARDELERVGAEREQTGRTQNEAR